MTAPSSVASAPSHAPQLARVIALDPERPGRLPAPRRLAELVEAVERSRAPLPERLATPGGLAVLHQADLRAALRAGELDAAEDAAVALWRRHGLVRAHAVVEALLHAVAQDGVAGLAGPLDELLSLATAERLVARLHRRTPRPGGALVAVVATDGWGIPAVVARARAHQVEEAGWSTLVTTPSDTARLRRSDRVVAVLLPGDDVAELVAALRRGPLTSREAEVLRHVADGLTNSEVGERLGVGAATVRSHLDRVFAKTGTTHRAAAVAVALRSGWVS